MIRTNHQDAIRSLSPEHAAVVAARMSARRPEFAACTTGEAILERCLTDHISQAEVILSMATVTEPVAVAAVEAVLGKPIERVTTARRSDRVTGQVVTARPRGQGGRQQAADGRVIRLLVDANPKREGTSAHVRFARYRDGMTVDEFIAAGGTMGDVKWDAGKGFIRVEAAAAE